MLRGRVSISQLLDDLGQLGEVPAVNPVKAKDGALPPVEFSSYDLGFLGWLIVALLAIIAIVLVTIFGPPTTGAFIYAQF